MGRRRQVLRRAVAGAGLVIAASQVLAYDAAGSKFMLIAIPDPQYETLSDTRTSTYYTSEMNWGVSHRNDAMNLAFVSGMGDNQQDGNYLDYPTNTVSNSAEWFRASGAWDVLKNNNIPYYTVIGNHDYMHWDNITNPFSFRQYFSPSRYTGSTAIKGWITTSDTSSRPYSGLDTYTYFYAGGYKFLSLNLQFNPDSTDMAWAQSVINANPGLPTIVSTHNYQDNNGRDSAGTALWNGLINSNSQIFMVLSGHISGTRQQTSTDAAGKPVFEILTDYQDYPSAYAGGQGYLRYFTFDFSNLSNASIHAQTYSPALNNYLVTGTGASATDFTLNIDFLSRFGAAPGLTYTWDPGATQSSGGGGSGTWDQGSTNNWFDGGTDAVWSPAGNITGVFAGSAGTVTIASGGVTASSLAFNTTGYTVSGGQLTLTQAATLDNNGSGGTVTINSVIAGSSGVNVVGGGFTFNGANTFTGGLALSGSSWLNFSADNNLGGAGGGVTLNGATLAYTGTGSLTLNRVFTLGASGGSINTVNSGSSGKLIISGTNTLTGSGQIIKDGPGWLTLYASGGNNLTGPWTVLNGVLEAGNAGVLGSGAITVSNGAELSVADATAVPNAITLNAGGTLGADFGTANSTATYSGPITVSGNANVQLGNFWSTASQNIVLSGALSGSGLLTTTNAAGASSSTGVLTLSGNNSGWSGGLAVNAGTVSFAADSNLGTGPVSLNGGILSYSGSTSVTESRVFTIGSGGGTFAVPTAGSSGGKLVVSGANLITGSGPITKTGPGWMTIYGSGNNATGNWTINGGVVELGAAAGLGTGSATVNSSAELSVNSSTAVSNPVTLGGGTLSADFSTAGSTGTYSGPVTVNAPSTVRLGNFWSTASQNVKLTGNLSGSGSLTTANAAGASSSTGTLTLAGNNSSFSGGLVIPTGTVATSSSATKALGTGPVTLSGGTLLLGGQVGPGGAAGSTAAVSVSGFNKDVIFGASDSGGTTTAGLDNVYSFYQNGYNPAGTSLTHGIASTSLTSAVGSTPFTLQSFTANNTLALAQNSTGTLALSNPTTYTKLSVLATSTWGADETPNVKINFADGTSVTTTYKAFDWYIGTDATKQGASAFGTAGIYRYGATGNPQWDQRAFGMYQTDIDLTNIGGVDYSYRPVASLTFTAGNYDTGGRETTEIFALSGAARQNAASSKVGLYGNGVTVNANSTIDVAGVEATMGTLTIGSNTLTVKSDDTSGQPYVLAFSSTTENGTPTFNILNSAGNGRGTLVLNTSTGQVGEPAGVAGFGGASAPAPHVQTYSGLCVTSGTVAIQPHAAGDPRTLVITSSLGLTGTGSVDIANNDLLLKHDGSPSAADSIRALLHSARNGGAWDGNGLTSSTAAAGHGIEAIAYAEASDLGLTSIDGQSVGPDSLLLRTTYYGDLNMDGVVNADDFALMDAQVARHGLGAPGSWTSGDFNYDGVVDMNDFLLMDTAFAKLSGELSATLLAQRESQFGPAYTAELLAAVPEPATMTLCTLSGLVFLRRRSPRRSRA